MCGGINFSSVSMIFPLDFGTVLTGNFFVFLFYCLCLLFLFLYKWHMHPLGQSSIILTNKYHLLIICRATLCSVLLVIAEKIFLSLTVYKQC
jgi:hypothetical protein